MLNRVVVDSEKDAAIAHAKLITPEYDVLADPVGSLWFRLKVYLYEAEDLEVKKLPGGRVLVMLSHDKNRAPHTFFVLCGRYAYNSDSEWVNGCHKIIGTVQMQRGPIREVGENGLQIDDLLEICQAQLNQFSAAFPDDQHTFGVRGCVAEAKEILAARRHEREQAGIEGTSKQGVGSEEDESADGS